MSAEVVGILPSWAFSAHHTCLVPACPYLDAFPYQLAGPFPVGCGKKKTNQKYNLFHIKCGNEPLKLGNRGDVCQAKTAFKKMNITVLKCCTELILLYENESWTTSRPMLETARDNRDVASRKNVKSTFTWFLSGMLKKCFQLLRRPTRNA